MENYEICRGCKRMIRKSEYAYNAGYCNECAREILNGERRTFEVDNFED